MNKPGPNGRGVAYRAMRAAGLTLREIAKYYGVTTQAVSACCAERFSHVRRDLIRADAERRREGRPQRPPYRCGRCGQVGHNRQTCGQRPPSA